MAQRIIRLELVIDFDREHWPGDDIACEAVMLHIPSSVIDLGSLGETQLLINSMTAVVVE